MKDRNLQELKPIYIHEASYISDDEISLIDLVMVLVRRRNLMTIVFVSTIILGTIGALLTPKTYTYSTSLQIGSRVIQGTIEPFESSQTLLAKLQYSFIPLTLSNLRSADPDNKKYYNVDATVPINSQIIILEIKGTDDQAPLITQLLRNISKKVTLDHERIYNAIKQNLIALINQAKTELTTLSTKDSDQTDKKQLLHKNIEVYQGELANLQNTHAISSPMKSLEPTGISKRLIVMISIFIGIIIAIIAAFIAEFVQKVKEQGKA